MRDLKSKSAPVGVISKVLRVLELLDRSPYGLQLREIAAKTGINKSTAHRFLCHLEAEGYLFRDDTSTYMLGARLAHLGTGMSFHKMLCRICRPTLEGLRLSTNETINLAVLDGAEIVYLDVLESPQPFRLASPLGMRRPAHCTSLGKAILANLEDERKKEEIVSFIQGKLSTARKASNNSVLEKDLRQICAQGYALDDEETVIGARCIGAAIFGAEGGVVGGISISAPVVRMTRERLPFFSAEVCRAARELSLRLSHRSFKRERATSPTVAGSAKKSAPAARTKADAAKRAAHA
jgi:DNA-binding IclR family transcriptional regulator